MSQYQYTPLDDTSIRTLELLPGEFDDPLKGCIEHRIFVPFRHKEVIRRRWMPIYEALSYAWGEQDDLEALTIIDDSTRHESFLRIGNNLASALRDLRKTSESRVIWCDAVCINQQDLPERAAQVQRMADIYRHANRVVAWLAPNGGQISHAMRMLDEFGSHVGLEANAVDFYTHEGMDYSYLNRDYLVPLSRYEWQCVGDLLSLPWFTRLWVIQEITLANDSALLTSGRRQLLWSRFRSAVAYLNHKLKWDETIEKAIQTAEMTAVFSKAMQVIDCKTWTYNSLDIILSTKHCQCADPRDKIYGVLGLQTDFGIPIDYTKTAKEVYTDWVLGYHRHHSRLDFLELCEIADYPSWVPDIAEPMTMQVGRVNAHSGSETKAVFDVLLDRTSKILATHCGTITELTTAMPKEPDPELIRERFKSWISQFFPRGIQSHDLPKIDELATAISGGHAVENYDSSRFNMMDVKNALLRDSEKSFPSKPRRGPMDPKLFTELSNLLPNAAVCATRDGHFGLGSGAACIGDEIFVLLGCNIPIIMRSVENSRYRIVATCYFPHLSHGEAILGKFPDGWKAMFNKHGGLYFVAPDGSHTFEDPRVKRDLPPGWEQAENERGLWWKRFEDEDWRPFDPRQTPEKLEARGVKLEMITVV